MADFIEKTCPKCSQRLRVPKGVGGVTLVCPTCGKKMASDFKIGPVGPRQSGGVGALALAVFELPGRLLDRLLRLISPK